jgi:hypothetical protein
VNSYDELVERCAEIIPLSDEPATIVAREVLAEVARTLETWESDTWSDKSMEVLLAMIHDSPLTPPK